MVYLTDKETHKAMVKETKKAIEKGKKKKSKEQRELEKKQKIFFKKIAKNKIQHCYDKEVDILSLFWGPNVSEHSRELRNANVVIDFDKNANIVGIEIFDFSYELKKSQEELDKIFNIKRKKRKFK
jgi:uncharacterized protein YuzE